MISFFMWSCVVFLSSMVNIGVLAGVPNLYSILDINQNADIGEIKKAYKKRSKELHPDRNPGDEFVYEQYQYIDRAYEIFTNAQKKQIYDHYGYEELERQEKGGSRSKGQDLKIIKRVTLAELYTGK